MLKRFLIVTIRAVRGSSLGKAVAVLAVVGIGYGLTQAASLVNELSNQRTMLAGVDETTPDTEESPVLPPQAWSETTGGRDFEKVVSVALLPDGEIAFAGLSVGLSPEDGSKAMLVRTSDRGDILSETDLTGADQATVSDIELDSTGDAFVTAWQEGAIKVTKVDTAGTFLWERRFTVANQAARVIVAPSRNGAAMVLLAEAFNEGEIRVMRLDADGRVVWRRDVTLDLGGTRSLGISADTIGGGVFAASVESADGLPGVELVRLDRRGREIWRQTVRTGYDAGLSDLAVDADGVAVLIGGTGAQIFKLDPLGQFIWARDLPDLNAAAGQLVSRSDTGEIHVIAEPLAAIGESRIWTTSFDADGQPNWTRLLAHDRTVRMEDFAVDHRGGIYAGGAISRRRNSDTDLFMVAVTPGGDFPDGFEEIPMSDSDQSRPVDRGPLVSLDSGDPIATASIGTPDAGPGDIILSADAGDAAEPVESVREVSAPEALAVTAVAIVPEDGSAAETPAETLDEPADAAPEPATPDLPGETAPAAETLAIDETPAPAPTPSQPALTTIDAPAGTTSGNFAYACTYICQATMVDESLRYPVTRRIANVSESNAELFSLDAMALDAGICLASGGKVPEGTRLPPACERTN